MSFTDSPQFIRGQAGERLVVGFLQSNGFGVVPSYEYSGKANDKAPRLMFRARGLVLPDLDVCRSGKRFWVEVKTYHGPAFNRALNCDVHGISKRLYVEYLTVEKESGCPVFVAVLEVDTGHFLIAQLSSLKVHPCMCSSCKNVGSCLAPIKKGVYWPRSAMVHRHSFSESQMVELRRMVA